MNRARRAAAVIVAALVLAAVALIGLRLLSGALTRLRVDGGPSAKDPQFAEPADTVTRPPELSEEAGTPAGGDPSAGWSQGAQTPVDKTADELAREAAEQG